MTKLKSDRAENLIAWSRGSVILTESKAMRLDNS
jgi:hypothetical protein